MKIIIRITGIMICFMVITGSLCTADILVLINGKKIYSKEPFNFTERGVEFTLPSGIILFIRKSDIDFEATKKINELLNKKRTAKTSDSVAASTKTTASPASSEKTLSQVQENAQKGRQSDISGQNGTKTDKIGQNIPETAKVEPKIEQQTVPNVISEEKPHEQAKAVDTQATATTLSATAEKIETKQDTAKTGTVQPKAKPDASIKPPAEPKSIERYNGIPVESINMADITLDELIEMARSVEWDYTGICPVCQGTGNSLLSTKDKTLVCPYCNGTGKGGKWNDDELMIGDDCPWCILGYDELAKGPCKHCLGTGRYLALEKLIPHLLDSEKSSVSDNQNNNRETEK